MAIATQEPRLVTSAQRRPSLWQRIVRGMKWTWQRDDWAGFVGDDWATTIMSAGLTDNFHEKQGRSTGRLLLENSGQKLGVYLKRHYHLPRWSGLLSVLCPWRHWSPAVQEMHNLEWAHDHGLPVPRPVAAGEFLGPWGKLQSILVVEELAGMLPLHEAIPLASRQLDPANFRRWKNGLIREMARLARQLHKHRYFHKDLYLCHFFVAQEDIGRTNDWRGRVFLIDFHRLARHRVTWPMWMIKDLGQLLYSAEIEGVDVRDRLRFWRCYSGKRGASRSALARIICLKKAIYKRHNARKLAGPALGSERGHS